MRPLLLEVEGFSVYRKKQIIDFSNLNFFVIQGKTGAGKTSIVDAITYALFGKVPRYHGSQKQINTKVLSKGETNLKVIFEFIVKGKKYRIERFFSLKPKARTMVRVYEEDRRLDIKTKDKEFELFIEKILGMSYDIFTKVILLPQGEFDKFLKPPKTSDRREILLKLLGIDFESIQKKASEQYKELQGEYKEIEREYQNLKNVNEEQVFSIEEEIKRLECEEKHIKNKLKYLEDRVLVAKKHGELKKKYDEYMERKKKLEDMEEYIKKISEKIKEYKKLIPYIPYINIIEKLDNERREYIKEKEDIERKYFSITKEIEILNDNMKTKLKLREKLPSLKEKLESMILLENKLKECITKLQNIKEYQKEINLLEKDKELLLQKLVDLEERINKGSRLTDELKEEIDNLKKYENILPEVIKLEKEREKLEDYEKKKVEYEKKLYDLEKSLREKMNLLESLRGKRHEFEKKLEEFTIEKIRLNLSKGDRCPICGNVYKKDHKPIHTKEDISSIAENFEKLKRFESETEREVGNIEGSLKEIEGRIKELEKEREKIVKIVNESPYSTYNIEEVKNYVELLKKKTEDLGKYQDRLIVLKTETGKLKEQLVKKESEIRRLHTTIKEYNSYIREVLEMVKHMKLSKGESITQIYEDVVKNIKSIRENIELIEKDYEDLRTKIEMAKRKEVMLKEKLDSLNKLLEDIDKRYEDTSEKLSDIFVKYGSISKIKSNLMSEEEARKFEEEIEYFKREKEITERGILDITQELKSITVEESYEVILEKKDKMKVHLENIQKKIGSLSKEREHIIELIEKKKDIRDRKEDLERLLKVYERIKTDLRSDKLQNFTANLMMLKLIDSANAYFYDFTGVYSFDFDESGNLLIIDHSLPYDNKRVIDSLSGGETFIASLCLALGLSDVLSQNATLDSLFIDEGFGSLDEETREKAGETLEMLKTKINRMIGIITHITDLADRFDQKIIVKKKGNISTIEVIY